jgi:ABC-2 type transport system permease protein
MSGATHVHYEILRSLRNVRVLALSWALPLVVFYAVAPEQRHVLTDCLSVATGNGHGVTDCISFPLYFMTAMAAYGAMWATITPGGRIAVDRSKGWTRQLRTTPLRVRTEVAAKLLTSYLVALPSLALLYLAGLSLGVRLDAAQWFEMTGLLIVGLVPFVAIGIVFGHLVPTDAIALADAGFVVILALLGGAFGTLFKGGVMLTIVKLLPSYWLVQAGKTAIRSGSWPVEGWIVVAVWTVCLIPLAAFAYQRDTATL